MHIAKPRNYLVYRMRTLRQKPAAKEWMFTPSQSTTSKHLMKHARKLPRQRLNRQKRDFYATFFQNVRRETPGCLHAKSSRSVRTPTNFSRMWTRYPWINLKLGGGSAYTETLSVTKTINIMFIFAIGIKLNMASSDMNTDRVFGLRVGYRLLPRNAVKW